MSVKLKHRKNDDGTTSQFLVIWKDGKRKYEFLNHLKLCKATTPLDREENREKKRLAEKIATTKALELQSDESNVTLEMKNGTDFIKHFEEFKDNYNKKDKRIVNACFNKFLEFIKEEGIKELNSKKVDESFCLDFKEFLESSLNGESPANYFSKFKKMLRNGAKRRILKNNPAEDISISKGEGIKKEILTFDEIQLLAKTKSTNEQVKKAFLFSCLTGLRFCDIQILDWKNINGKVLKLVQQKTGKPVTINLNESSLRIVGNPMEGKIFNLPSHTACSKDLKVWCKNAGIKKKITWHCARHSFATNIIYYGSDVNSASSLLGHSSLTFTQRYVHIVESLKEKAVENLPSIHI